MFYVLQGVHDLQVGIVPALVYDNLIVVARVRALHPRALLQVLHNILLNVQRAQGFKSFRTPRARIEEVFSKLFNVLWDAMMAPVILLFS